MPIDKTAMFESDATCKFEQPRVEIGSADWIDRLGDRLVFVRTVSTVSMNVLPVVHEQTAFGDVNEAGHIVGDEQLCSRLARQLQQSFLDVLDAVFTSQRALRNGTGPCAHECADVTIAV